MDIGARLRHARETKGLSIDALSRSTRVQPRLISAIEQNDAVTLPPRPYGRGFVRAYASEVGLDPDGTVREFFSQFTLADALPKPAPRRQIDDIDSSSSKNGWLWPVGAVLAYAAVGLLVIFAGRWALQNGGEAGAVGTSGTQLPAASALVERQPPAAARTPPAPTGIVVVLEATGPAWVTASVDGVRTVYRTLAPGERVNLTATTEVSIRTGDAGAMTWQVNGRAATVMGQPGKVRSVRVTLENAAEVK